MKSGFVLSVAGMTHAKWEMHKLCVAVHPGFVCASSFLPVSLSGHNMGAIHSMDSHMPLTSHPLAAFRLDPRLEADGPVVADLPLSHVRLVDDARFFWLVLVPRRADRVEIMDLAPEDRALLMEEISAVSGVLKGVSGCAKLNVAALGNMVPQLHVHIVARNPGDAAWPGPVFGVGEREKLDEATRAARLDAIRKGLGPLVLLPADSRGQG